MELLYNYFDSVKRNVVNIKPKQPLFNWIKNISFLYTALILIIAHLSSNCFAQKQINNNVKKFSTIKDSNLFKKLIL